MSGIQKFLLAIGILFALAGGVSVAQQAVNVLSSIGVAQGSTTSGQTLQPIGVTTRAGTTVMPIGDPCQTGTKIFVPISQTANTQLITGTASARTYVCHIFVFANAAEAVTLVSGTGSVCGTSTGAMIGATTALTSLAANGGYSLGNGGYAIAQSDTDNDNVCLFQDGSDRVTGVISYVAQ